MESNELENDRLKEIQRNNCSRKITNLFRKLKESKNYSHQVLCKEYSIIPSSAFILDLNNDDLDVNLAPEINCLYLGTKFKDMKDGLGLEIFGDTKAKYFGIFKNGKRTDAGQFTICNEYKDYYYYGQIKGIYAWEYGWFEDRKNFTFYEGMWKNSMKNGIGIENYADKLKVNITNMEDYKMQKSKNKNNNNDQNHNLEINIINNDDEEVNNEVGEEEIEEEENEQNENNLNDNEEGEYLSQMSNMTEKGKFLFKKAMDECPFTEEENLEVENIEQN